VLKLT